MSWIAESFEDYLSSEGISSSDLRAALKSIFYWCRRPPLSTKSTNLGTAVHTMLLEPELIPRKIILDNWHNRYTDEYKRWKRRHKDKIIINELEYQAMLTIAQNAIDHELASEIITGSRHEVSGYHNNFLGESVKIRVDCLDEYLPRLSDIKTTYKIATQDSFRGAIRYYGYHIQAAFYLDVANAIEGYRRFEKFAWIVAETTPPHSVVVYYASPNWLEMGRVEYRRALNKIVENTKNPQAHFRYDGDGQEIEPAPWEMREYGLM